MDQNLFEGLTEEQKEAVKKCKTTEEIMELAAKEGIEMNETQMAAINGGGCCAFYCVDAYSGIEI